MFCFLIKKKGCEKEATKKRESKTRKGVELVLCGHHGYSDMDNEREKESASRQKAGGLAKGETLSLALFL